MISRADKIINDLKKITPEEIKAKNKRAAALIATMEYNDLYDKFVDDFPRLMIYCSTRTRTRDQRAEYMIQARKLICDHYHYGEQAIVLNNGFLKKANELIINNYRGCFASLETYCKEAWINMKDLVVILEKNQYGRQLTEAQWRSPDNNIVIYWHEDINKNIHVFSQIK